MATFGERLRDLRLSKEMTQDDLAEAFGISKQAISQYERGIRFPKDYEQIADFFNVDLDYLMGRSDTYMRIMHTPSPTKIPVLGRVIAGIPIEAIEDIIDWEEIPERMAKDGEYFALKIKGDSMTPRIQERDVVIVKKQSDVDSGDIAIVLVNGFEATCKQVMKSSDGITLISFNPSYKPLIYSNEEIRTLPVIILGEVVELRRKF